MPFYEMTQYRKVSRFSLVNLIAKNNNNKKQFHVCQHISKYYVKKNTTGFNCIKLVNVPSTWIAFPQMSLKCDEFVNF